MRADNVNQSILGDLLDFNPDTVFLCLGGNDITVDSCPRQIFNNIVDIVNTRGAKTVYISEILTRGLFLKYPGLTKKTFDRKRKLINKHLQKKYGHLFVTFPDIHFPKHYDDDRVHLYGRSPGQTSTHTSVHGMKKFMCRIARVLCRH